MGWRLELQYVQIRSNVTCDDHDVTCDDLFIYDERFKIFVFLKPVVPPPGFESYEMTPGNLKDLETKKWKIKCTDQ